MLKPLILALILSAAPASALPQDQPLSVRVGFADLDLGSPEGRATLDRRLAEAVRKVCPAQWGSGLRDLSSVEACRRLAFASARDQSRAIIAWHQQQLRSKHLIAAK